MVVGFLGSLPKLQPLANSLLYTHTHTLSHTSPPPLDKGSAALPWNDVLHFRASPTCPLRADFGWGACSHETR